MSNCSNCAATIWVKWVEDSPFNPALYEWCLWTMVINGQRNYFSGSLVETEGKVFLSWDRYGGIEPDDTVYWARVNILELKKLEVENG